MARLQSLGELPTPREHHSACFVADRYLLIYGGVDSEGTILDTASVYDVGRNTWQTVKGIHPRKELKSLTHCGMMYIMGGKSMGGYEQVTAAPLCTPVYNFLQVSCMDFLGNNQQVSCDVRAVHISLVSGAAPLDDFACSSSSACLHQAYQSDLLHPHQLHARGHHYASLIHAPRAHHHED